VPTIDGRTAFITGGNRGLGRAIGLTLLEQGAAKVYAGARDTASVTDPGLTAVRLDVTDDETVRAAARLASDVDLVVNNSALLVRGNTLHQPAAELRDMLDVNVLGALRVTQAFAPVLARNGGGALVDILSVASWFATPNGSGYAATKAALWSLTNAWRRELGDQGTHVLGVHVGPLDTEPQKDYQGEKLDPFDLARQIIAALELGEVELLADERTRAVKAILAGSPAHLG
jgi:NAD(P)-dependent dehydrogenase (short-subunit alcohol dehydrogenase family)